MLLQAPRGLAGSWACEKFQILLLWSEALTHSILISNSTMSPKNQVDSTCYCIEKNSISVSGIKLKAKLVSEPAKLLGAWRRCLHASADSRTGGSTREPIETSELLNLVRLGSQVKLMSPIKLMIIVNKSEPCHAEWYL